MNDSKLIYCPFCFVVFDSSDRLQNHIDTLHSEPNSTDTFEKASPRDQSTPERRKHSAHRCPLCDSEFSSIDDLTTHASSCGDTDAVVVIVGASSSATSSSNYSKSDKLAEISETHLNGRTSGVITKLCNFYSDRRPRTIRSGLLSSSTDHYSIGLDDRGFGCGYRNFQMLLSCLLDHEPYRSELRNAGLELDHAPSIPDLQRLIEQAWQEGYDVAGASQLNHNIVGTHKWIGATEIAAALRFMNIRAELVDFWRKTGQDRNASHPRLLDWVQSYFRDHSNQTCPPLYFQHEGHSRTIIGVEEDTNGSVKLLIFDPSLSCSNLRKKLESFNERPADLLRHLRRNPSSINKEQYQIVFVNGVMQSENERQKSRLLHSTRVP